MRELALTDIEGVRFVPAEHCGVGALVLAGSSGRVDSDRARVFGARGVLAESIRWFGGQGQHDGPWEIPIETFSDRVGLLRRECERVIVVGSSFGAEAALLTAALSEQVDVVVAFAPSDVVWAGVTANGRITSHWAYQGMPLPFLHVAEDWKPADDPPAYVDLHRYSRIRFSHEIDSATIAVEQIPDVVLIAGGDDRVWPAVDHSERIRDRRAAYGLETTVVTDKDAGHRAILPGEPVVTGGIQMQRGGHESADRRLGHAAWERILTRLS